MLSFLFSNLTTESLSYAEDIENENSNFDPLHRPHMTNNNNDDDNSNNIDYSENFQIDGVFNIAVAGDWGCEDDTKKTVENIQSKNPELVIAAGDLSYEESAECWMEIIEPLKSRMKIAMGDHEYDDTNGKENGLIYQYLKPFNLEKTYYSFDKNNVHVTIMDPYIDYEPGSAQYKFIEQDLKDAASNPSIDWSFVVESIPIYSASSKHEADSDIRDIFHPLFDKYGVDLVFSSDNHNYQRTFPLKYNNGQEGSDHPIVTYTSQNNNYYTNKGGDNTRGEGVVYLIIGTGGRSLYDVEEGIPFVASHYDKEFGFLNIDVYSKNALRGTFYANANEYDSYRDGEDDNYDDANEYYFISTVSTTTASATDAAPTSAISPDENNIVDRFIISNTKYQENYSS